MPARKTTKRTGPKPAPVALKIASGVRPDRIPTGTPEAPPGAPEPPAWLDEYGVEDFRRMTARVAKLGSCPTWMRRLSNSTRWRTAGSGGPWMLKADLVIEGRTVGAQLIPRWGSRNGPREMLTIEASFGLTPSDRSRIKAAVESPKDELEAFLEERKAR